MAYLAHIKFLIEFRVPKCFEHSIICFLTMLCLLAYNVAYWHISALVDLAMPGISPPGEF